MLELLLVASILCLIPAIGWAIVGGALLGALGAGAAAREQRRGMEQAAAAQDRAAEIQKEIAEQQLQFERERYGFHRGLIEAAQRGSEDDVNLLRTALGFSPSGAYVLPAAQLINISAAGRAMQENLRQNLLALSGLRIDPTTLASLVANAEMMRQMELGRMASEAQQQAAAQVAAFNTQRLMQLAGLGGAVQTPNVMGAMSPYAERIAQAGAMLGQMRAQMGQNLMQGVGMLAQGITNYGMQQAYLNHLAKLQQQAASAASVPTVAVISNPLQQHFLPTIRHHAGV